MRPPWDEEGDEDHGNGEKRDEDIEGAPVKDDVAVNAVGVGVEGVELLHHRGDDHDQGHDNEDIDSNGEVVYAGVPAGMGMLRAQDALCEEDIDNEEEHNPSRRKDLRGNGDWDTVRSTRPSDAHDHGNGTGHAKAKHHAGNDELMGPLAIDLEDRHV